jgi:hypothetical protein
MIVASLHAARLDPASRLVKRPAVYVRARVRTADEVVESRSRLSNEAKTVRACERLLDMRGTPEPEAAGESSFRRFLPLEIRSPWERVLRL